jgi:hypothetical protein
MQPPVAVKFEISVKDIRQATGGRGQSMQSSELPATCGWSENVEDFSGEDTSNEAGVFAPNLRKTLF